MKVSKRKDRTLRSFGLARRRSRLYVEPLEARQMLAHLGLGIRLLSNVPLAGSTFEPVAVISETGSNKINVNDEFWIEVVVEDQRGTEAPGVISLPLNLSWDPDKIQLLGSPLLFPTQLASNPAAAIASEVSTTGILLTPNFVLQRFVEDFDATIGHSITDSTPNPVVVPNNANVQGLRGAAVPNAPNLGIPIAADNDASNTIDAEEKWFARLKFKAIATAEDTPFTIQVAGSMSFADGAELEPVKPLLSPARNYTAAGVRPPQDNGGEGSLAITEFFDIVADNENTLSGYVYCDSDLSGTFTRDSNGVPTEMGLPNVTINLIDSASGALVRATTTGPDGWYQFTDIPAGTYDVVETQPSGFTGADADVGFVLPANMPRGIAGTNRISGIQLNGSEDGVEYNFGDCITRITKRMFLASTDPTAAIAKALGVVYRTVKTTTNGNDTITVTASPNFLNVNVNGSSQLINLSTVDVVVIDAKAGQDTITFIGSTADELAHLTPGRIAFRRGTDYAGTNHGVVVSNVEKQEANAGSGTNDLAVIEDSPRSNDLITAKGTVGVKSSTATVTYSASVYSALAAGFDRVRAVSRSGGDKKNVDSTTIDYVLHLVGDWT